MHPSICRPITTTHTHLLGCLPGCLPPSADIQEYYANTGALRRAAQVAKGPSASTVGCSIVEAFSKEVGLRLGLWLGCRV